MFGEGRRSDPRRGRLRRTPAGVWGHRQPQPRAVPFHDSLRADHERRPGFVILGGRVGYCHGCGWKGDVFSFVQKRDGVDFPSALRILADRVGIELDDKGRGGARRRNLSRRQRAVVCRFNRDPDLSAMVMSPAIRRVITSLYRSSRCFRARFASVKNPASRVDSLPKVGSHECSGVFLFLQFRP